MSRILHNTLPRNLSRTLPRTLAKFGVTLAAGIAGALGFAALTLAQTTDQPAAPSQVQAAPQDPAAPSPQEPSQEPSKDLSQDTPQDRRKDQQKDQIDALSKALSEVGPAPKESAAPKIVARYSFDRVNGAILRLDSVSGQLTVCSPRTAGWVCQAVPEDRAALEKEIGRLQGEVADLKNQVATLREPPPPPRPPAELAPGPKDEPKSEPKTTLKLPSHEEMHENLERARVAIERAWRRLVDMINGFQRDMTEKG